MKKEQVTPGMLVSTPREALSIIVDTRMQTILESLYDAKNLFNEVYTQIKYEGDIASKNVTEDFMTNKDNAISNASYMAAQKIEFDLKVLYENKKKTGEYHKN